MSIKFGPILNDLVSNENQKIVPTGRNIIFFSLLFRLSNKKVSTEIGSELFAIYAIDIREQ